MVTRRNRKMLKLALVAGVAVTVGAFVAGPKDAGAAITDPVSYTVGGTADGAEGVRVFFGSTRNASCSVSRNVVNETGIPVRVLSWVTWEGQLTPVLPKPGTSAMDGDDDLAVGEQSTVVFTNSDHVADGALTLHMAWTLAGESIVVAQHAEQIEACRAPVVPSDTTPTVSVDTTPPVVPPSTVVQAPGPDPTTPPLVGSDPEPPTTVTSASETGVLTSSVGPLEQLPNTGPGDVVAVSGLIGALFLIVGSTLRALGWKVGRR